MTRLVVATLLATPFFQPRVSHQVVEEQRDDVVGLDEGAVFIDNAEAVCVAIGRDADLRANLLHLRSCVAKQMVVGLGRMAAKENIAVIVDGFNCYARFAQNVATVAATGSPERIEDYLDARFGDGLQVDQFAQGA